MDHVCLWQIVLQKSFAAQDSNSASRTRGDRIIMWGATLPRAKLTGDSGNPFGAALICDLRSFRALAENQPLCLLGLLQHYLPKADIARFIRLRYGRFIRTTSAAATAACASSVRGSDNRGAQWVTSSLSKCWANDGRTVPPVPGIAIERDDILAFDLLGFSLAEQPTFGPLGAARFRSTNRRRNGFHRVAPAALEDAVLESSHAGVYTLQIHTFPTRRAARTFPRQQLR